MDPKQKERRSPFLVDLVAENERIDEEYKVRMHQQVRRRKNRERRREEIKNKIILQALEESNDVDALRREKRKILEEEKRLKALIEIEKTKIAHRKEDRIAAVRAERNRLRVKRDDQRALNKGNIDEKNQQDLDDLRMKHNIKGPPDNTFSSRSK